MIISAPDAPSAVQSVNMDTCGLSARGSPDVLVVEDDSGIGRLLARGLSVEGYNVVWRLTGQAALDAARELAFHAVILDLGLPDMDGLDFCRTLRADGIETPVLVLTARETLNDKLESFSAGADDFLTKPFAYDELVARMNVLSRHGQKIVSEHLTVGRVRLDLRARRVFCETAPLEMSKREYEMFEYLARRMGDLVTRQDCLRHIWGPETQCESNIVDVYVGYVRRHLAARDTGLRIESLWGKGFRLSETKAE